MLLARGVPGGRKKHVQGNLATRVVVSDSPLRARYHTCMAALRLDQQKLGARTVPVRCAPWPRRTLHPPAPTVAVRTFAPLPRNSPQRHPGVLSRRVSTSAPRVHQKVGKKNCRDHIINRAFLQTNLTTNVLASTYDVQI